MKIFGLTTSGIELAGKSLNFVAESTAQISSNMANISTPGYKEFEFKDFEETLSEAMKAPNEGGLAKTNSRHFPTTNLNHLQQTPMQADEAGGIDGNTVNLDKQGVKLAENNIKYSAYTTIVGNELGSMKRAIGLSAQ